jgi:hypothetical protein
MPNDPVVSTPHDTRSDFLRVSGSGYLVVRQHFVQFDASQSKRSATLSTMVSERKHRALVLYLLLLTVWPFLRSRPPFSSAIWIRALTSRHGPQWNRSELSKAWTQLVELGLVEREREGRLSLVRPRREDGKADYTPPNGTKKMWSEAYFTLPGALWTEEWFAKLNLAELAVLLIVAKETTTKDEMYVTEDRVHEWYGISPNTLRKGVQGLERNGLLKRRPERRKAPLTSLGYTIRWWYSLTGPFSSADRRKAQGAAKAAYVASRPKAVASPASAPKGSTKSTKSIRGKGESSD